MSQVEHFHRQRFVVMSKARFTVDIHPDLAPAVDFELCRRAALFVGNAYSSFSFLLREAKMLRGRSETTLYYNAADDAVEDEAREAEQAGRAADADAAPGAHEPGTAGAAARSDLTYEEAWRWDVMPRGRNLPARRDSQASTETHTSKQGR